MRKDEKEIASANKEGMCKRDTKKIKQAQQRSVGSCSVALGWKLKRLHHHGVTLVEGAGSRKEHPFSKALGGRAMLACGS